MPTTGYQAGFESNAVAVAYAAEAIFKTPPAVAFQQIRLTSETLNGTKTRKPPQELMTSGEMPQNVTTQEAASGAINFALSFGTFDDWFAGCLGNPWGTQTAITATAGDTITTGGVISSVTANKYAAISAGQWVLISGFVNPGNNGVFYVSAKPTNLTFTVKNKYVNGVSVPFVAETATVSMKIVGSTVINGTTETSFTIQKQFSSNVFLQYPGSFIQSFQLSGTTADYISGSFTIFSAYEQQSTTSLSSGAVVAAPTRPVMAGVAGFGGILWNEVPISGVVDSFSLTVTNDGSNPEYGMGSPQSQGFLAGLMKVSGQLKIYFKDLTLYNNFKSETQGRLEIIMADTVGNTYVFTVLNCALMNPNVQAGQQNTPVYATFTIEGNPQTGGGTIQIDRLLVA